MRIIRDLKNEVLLDYILDTQDLLNLGRKRLSAPIMDADGNNTGLTAHLEVSQTNNSRYDEATIADKSTPITERDNICLQIVSRKATAVRHGYCAYMNWRNGDMYVRGEGVERAFAVI